MASCGLRDKSRQTRLDLVVYRRSEIVVLSPHGMVGGPEIEDTDAPRLGRWVPFRYPQTPRWAIHYLRSIGSPTAPSGSEQIRLRWGRLHAQVGEGVGSGDAAPGRAGEEPDLH